MRNVTGSGDWQQPSHTTTPARPRPALVRPGARAPGGAGLRAPALARRRQAGGPTKHSLGRDVPIHLAIWPHTYAFSNWFLVH